MVEFELSGWKEQLRNCSLRSGKYTNIETYYCKYERKKGYICAVKIRVKWSESSDHIYVETVGGEHRHDVEYCQPAEGSPNYLRWSEAQTRLVMAAVGKDATPAIIRRKLMDQFPEGKLPIAGQLSNKIAHCRKVMSSSKYSSEGTATYRQRGRKLKLVIGP